MHVRAPAPGPLPCSSWWWWRWACFFLGYVAFPSFLAWWMLIAALLAALVAGLVYGGRRPALVLPAMVTFTFVALLAEYLFLILVLAPRLN